MWWLSVAALAADPGHGLSIAGEVVALTSLPFFAGGATGLTLAAVRSPAEYAQSPYVEISYVGVALAGVGTPLAIAGAEMEAADDRKHGRTIASHGDVAAWATYGAAVATIAVGLPVASAVVKNNALAGPITVGSVGVAGTTLWLCSVGLASGFRGSLADGAVTLDVAPTANGVAFAGRF